MATLVLSTDGSLPWQNEPLGKIGRSRGLKISEKRKLLGDLLPPLGPPARRAVKQTRWSAAGWDVSVGECDVWSLLTCCLLLGV